MYIYTEYTILKTVRTVAYMQVFSEDFELPLHIYVDSCIVLPTTYVTVRILYHYIHTVCTVYNGDQSAATHSTVHRCDF
jgi:hypothetical protein